MIQKFMHSTGELSFLDRMLGAILGVAKGAFIMAVLLVPIELFPDVESRITADSLIAPYLKKASGYLKQNYFTNEIFNKNGKKFSLEKIDKSIKQFTQDKKTLKKLAPLKMNPSSLDIPQDKHCDDMYDSFLWDWEAYNNNETFCVVMRSLDYEEEAVTAGFDKENVSIESVSVGWPLLFGHKAA